MVHGVTCESFYVRKIERRDSNNEPSNEIVETRTTLMLVKEKRITFVGTRDVV
jgi:hypothetical protein